MYGLTFVNLTDLFTLRIYCNPDCTQKLSMSTSNNTLIELQNKKKMAQHFKCTTFTNMKKEIELCYGTHTCNNYTLSGKEIQ